MGDAIFNDGVICKAHGFFKWKDNTRRLTEESRYSDGGLVG